MEVQNNFIFWFNKQIYKLTQLQMYIDNISVENFKGFKNFNNLNFLYPSISKKKLIKSFDTDNVRYKNINIILTIHLERLPFSKR